MDSIGESSIDNDYDKGYISTNGLEEIWDGSKYTQKLTQEMLDWKYVTVLNKQKMNGNEKNSQQIVWEKF